MVEKEKFETVVAALNDAKRGEEEDAKCLLDKPLVLVVDELANYLLFMEACESVPEKWENCIPDDVADFYNALKKEVDEVKLVLPKPEEMKVARKKKAKTDTTVKEKKVKSEKKESAASIMKRLVVANKTETEISDYFTEYYTKKGQTDPTFIAKRISIYKKLSEKG